MIGFKNVSFFLIVGMALFVSSSTVQAANTFDDVGVDFWAQAEIEFLADQAIIGGYGDGTFQPNETVTRAQAALMLVKALGLETENRPNPQFQDIKVSHHAYKAIAAVADEGIINGNNGRFMPNQALKRGQMAAILDRAFKLTRYEQTRFFRDIDSSYIFYGSIQNLAFNRITTGYAKDQTFRPNDSTTRAQFSVFLARVLDDDFKPTVEDQPQQIIVVTTNSLTSQRATLRTYERRDGRMHEVFAPMSAVVGYSGISANKREGDGKTPVGIFDLSTAFGTAPSPAGVRLPYQRTTKNDYWIDDPSSPDYNQWKTYEGDPTKKWKSFERLQIDLYKYAVVMEYNTDPIVPGKGSAIFLHTWRGATSPTAGCVAIAEADLVKLLKWLDPKKMPIISVSLEEDVPEF